MKMPPIVAPRWSLLAGAGLLTLIFCVNVFRAATQSIVHDEAVTYNWYLAGSPDELIDMSANNHILHSLLAKAALNIFGHAELPLRLASLLGGLLSFSALWMLGARACRSGVLFILLLALVGLNPLFLDFCIAARGYGLATGFMLWGIFFALWATHAACIDASDPRYRRIWLWCSIALGLSLGSSLSLLFVNVSVAIFLATGLLSERARRESRDAAWQMAPSLFFRLALPGPLIALGLWWPLLLQTVPGHFYVGWFTLRESAAEFAGASLFAERCGIHSMADHDVATLELLGAETFAGTVVGFLSGAGVAVTIAIVAAAFVWLLRRAMQKGVCGLGFSRRLLLLCGFALLMTFGTFVLLNAVNGMRFPPDRAVVFLVPLLALTWVLLPNCFFKRTTRRGTRVAVGMFAICVVALAASNFRTTHFRIWRYDAGAADMALKLREQAEPGKNVRVGGQWIYSQALKCYQNMEMARGDEPWLQTGYQAHSADFFIAHPEDNAALDPQRWTPVLTDDASGARLFHKKSR